jgi:acetyltransferase-like isoleucine patch superfamily enzyme
MIINAIGFIKKFGYSLFILKIINVLYRPFRFNFISRFKGFYYFKTFTINLGTNVNINTPFFKSSVGENVSIYSNSIFEFGSNSKFIIGNNSLLSYGVLLSCMQKIQIGDNTQIGEYTSIRDTTHDYTELGKPMKYNPDISKDIIIGNNVWIGRGCIILPGTNIEDGVVVGANSVVKGHLPANNIYAGAPVKYIKSRVD